MVNNAITEIKSTLEGINSRITEEEDRMSEVEDRMVETNEAEREKEKKIKRLSLALRRLVWARGAFMPVVWSAVCTGAPHSAASPSALP